MGNAMEIQCAVVFAAIFGLVLAGSIISLGSGVPTLMSRRGLVDFLGNLWQVVIRVVAYVAGFVAIQQFVGFPVQLNW